MNMPFFRRTSPEVRTGSERENNTSGVHTNELEQASEGEAFENDEPVVPLDTDAEHAEKVRMITRKTAEIAARRLSPRTAIPSRIDVPENLEDTKTGRKAAI